MATQAEDVGALKYRAAELSSRLEMMQAQLSKVTCDKCAQEDTMRVHSHRVPPPLWLTAAPESPHWCPVGPQSLCSNFQAEKTTSQLPSAWLVNQWSWRH
jgi:hypothetical protein